MSAGDLFMGVYLTLFWGLVAIAVGTWIGWAIGRLINRKKPTINQTFVVSGAERLTTRQMAKIRSERIAAIKKPSVRIRYDGHLFDSEEEYELWKALPWWRKLL